MSTATCYIFHTQFIVKTRNKKDARKICATPMLIYHVDCNADVDDECFECNTAVEQIII